MSVLKDRYKQRPEWVEDAERSACGGCREPFTVRRRRHHCRKCGELFCDGCANHFLRLPQLGYFSPVRICRQCCHSVVSDAPSTQKAPKMVRFDTAQGRMDGLPTEWQRALEQQNVSAEELERDPDTVLGALQIIAPTDEEGVPFASSSPHSSYEPPLWMEAQQELKEANTMRIDDPLPLFENVQKLAEGGQGTVYRAQWKVDGPEKLKTRAAFVQSTEDGEGKDATRSGKRWSVLNRSSRAASVEVAAFFTPDIGGGTTQVFRDVAIKKVAFADVSSLEQMRNEIAMTRTSVHPHIIDYLETFVSGAMYSFEHVDVLK